MQNNGHGESAWMAHADKKIPSSAEAGKQIVAELLAQLQEQAWEESDIFGVHLAVEEAVVNAIKHGNQYDENKNVRITYRISPQEMSIEIQDQGNGFDPESLPDPTDDDNIELPSGRGVMLMRSFMSSVEFSDNGTCVTMNKVTGAEA